MGNPFQSDNAPRLVRQIGQLVFGQIEKTNLANNVSRQQVAKMDNTVTLVAVQQNADGAISDHVQSCVHVENGVDEGVPIERLG